MTGYQGNPFATSALEWEAMRDALHAAEESRAHLDHLAIKLLAENEMLHSQLAETRTELKFWMAYSVQIETRLDVISGVIQDARNEARAHAKAYNGTLHRERAEPPPAPPNPTPAAPQPTSQDRRPSLADVARQQRQPEQSDDDGAVEIVETIHKLANKWP